jgi:dethiobiotin synthetase
VVVIQPPERADTSTGTNARELQALGIARKVLAFPRAEVSAEGTAATAAALLTLIAGLPRPA